MVLDGAGELSAPALSDTTQALKQLVERLPQAFEQTADVLEMLAAQGKMSLKIFPAVQVDGQGGRGCSSPPAQDSPNQAEGCHSTVP